MLRLSLLLLLAVPAAAQPSAEALVASWLRAQAAADRALALDETLERRIEGPRYSVRVETDGRVAHAPGARPRRVAQRGTVNGEPLSGEELAELDDRLAHAFGPGGRELGQPQPLPHRLLERAEVRSVAPAELDGTPAWRVALHLDVPTPRRHRERRRGRPAPPPPSPDALTAWFSRDGARLLRLRVEGQRLGGALTRDSRFQRTGGLDVPTSVSARAELRQRRRLRSYAVEITSAASYRLAE